MFEELARTILDNAPAVEQESLFDAAEVDADQLEAAKVSITTSLTGVVDAGELTPGTATYASLILPLATAAAQLNTAVAGFSTHPFESVVNDPNGTATNSLDIFAASLLLTRLAAGTVSGTVVIELASSSAFTVPSTLRFNFAARAFAPVGTFQVLTPVSNSANTRHFVTVSVAETVTGGTSIGIGATCTVTGTSATVRQAYAADGFTAARGVETNLQLFDRAVLQLQPGTYDTKQRIAERIKSATSSVVDASVVGPGDIGAVRSGVSLFGISPSGITAYVKSRSGYSLSKVSVKATVQSVVDGVTTLTATVGADSGLPEGAYRVVAVRDINPRGIAYAESGAIAASDVVFTEVGDRGYVTDGSTATRYLDAQSASFSSAVTSISLELEDSRAWADYREGLQPETIVPLGGTILIDGEEVEWADVLADEDGSVRYYDVYVSYADGVNAAQIVLDTEYGGVFNDLPSVKAAIPVFCNVVFSFTDAASTVTTAAVKDAVAAFINALPMGTSSLYVSDILAHLQGVLPSVRVTGAITLTGTLLKPDLTTETEVSSTSLTIDTSADVSPYTASFVTTPEDIQVTKV